MVLALVLLLYVQCIASVSTRFPHRDKLKKEDRLNGNEGKKSTLLVIITLLLMRVSTVIRVDAKRYCSRSYAIS